MINRYLQPQLFNYQNQFVPTEIPWEALQGNMEKKQNKRDNFKTELGKSAASPTGLQYTTDHYGNTVELPDYNISAGKATEINNKLEELSKRFASSELNSDIYSDYSALMQEKAGLDNANKIFDARAKWIEEQTKYRRDQKVNPGDARDIQYQKELYKMMSPGGESYVPTVHGVQDIIDTGEWVKKNVGDIKVEATASMSKDAGYFNSYENRKITRDKILNSLTGGFQADQQMQEYVKNMADQNADLLYSRGMIESNDPNALMKTPDGQEISVYEATKQEHFNSLMQNAEKYIYSETKQKISADTSYWKGLERQDELNAKIPSLSIVNQEIKGKDKLTAMGILIDFKKNAQLSKATLGMEYAKVAAMEVNGITNSKEYLAAKAKITQIETANKNYEDLLNTAKDNYIKESLPNLMKLASVNNDPIAQKSVETAFKLAKNSTEFRNLLSASIPEGTKDLLVNSYEVDLNNEMTTLLQSEDKATERTLIHWGTGSKENKAIFADIQSQFKLADNIEAKDGNGNSINVNTAKLDMEAGYGIFADVDGKLKLKLKSKTDGFFSPADDVIVELDDRTTFGKKLLQDAYRQADELFKATGDSQYEQLADEIETTVLNNEENLITSFRDDTKMAQVQNKFDAMSPGTTWTYSQVSPDGSDKMFYNITALGNKQFDVIITDGNRNDITDKMLGEHEPVSSPQEIYKLMQRQNGRR